jgi:hypothetical protein
MEQMNGAKPLAERRSLSQVVYNFLPDQIIDLRGRVWKSKAWRDPIHLRVDDESVRKELRRALAHWLPGTDGDLKCLLPTIEIDIVTPSEAGVEVVPFPKLYRCQRCGQVDTNDKARCVEGAHHAWASFPFVAYHTCGKLTEPFVPRCKEHNKVRVSLPRSRNARDLKFTCPVCKILISEGVPYTNCGCGNGRYSISPPRAGTVFTGHSVVVINPPSTEVASDFSGEAARVTTLDWVLDGMPEENPLTRTRTIQALIDQFVRMGIGQEQANEMAVAAAKASGGQIAEGSADVDLVGMQREAAIDGALKLAYATLKGRLTLAELQARGEAAFRERYQGRYPAMLSAGLLESVNFLEKFPILTAFYGYSRGEGTRAAGAVPPTLNWFRDRGRLRLYSLKAETEALVFSLDPTAVADWLARRGMLSGASKSKRATRVAILKAAEIPAPGEFIQNPTLGSELLTLVHTYAHRVMRSITAFCGIDREALAEYLIPEHLSFIVYANNRGDFVLGGLQALYENDLDRALHAVVEGERRCALDPGCREAGSACMACMHVGEPSCRFYNRSLTREALFGDDGFLVKRTTAGV